jgi:hypothetical protein
MLIPEHLSRRRLRRGNLGSIEQDEYCDIIAALIFLSGGRARRQTIISAVHSIYSSQFTAADYELLNSQTPPKARWIHNIDWAKRKLVLQGVLLPPSQSPYGTWALSEIGSIRAAKSLAETAT